MELTYADVTRWRRALQQAKPSDSLARFTERQHAERRARLAHREQLERLIAESRALRAAANQRLDAPHTTQGQLLAVRMLG
jgi:hypothetical protein